MIVVVRGWRWIGGAAVAVLALLALLSWVRWAGLPADVAVPATTGGPVDEPGTVTLSAAPGARGIGVALVVAAAGIAPLILAILTPVAAGVGAIVLPVLVLVLRRRPPRTVPPPWTVH